MSRVKYVARHNGQIIGTRNSTIATTDKIYTHAVAVWGHGLTAKVKTWCSRLDLAQSQQRVYTRYGFTAVIVPVEILAPKAATPTSWMAEVIADSSGKWCGNAVRFATKAEAEFYATDLSCRWTAVREHRVVESADPVNYAIIDNVITRLGG
jgi:hypothetical protein